MVEIIINGKGIELLKKGQGIKYTRQIADVFDISSVSSSYTNSFSVPKTPLNTQIFEHLGMVGDQSTIPYTKTTVTVKDNGFDLVRQGWLNVTETNESYKCSIIDGMIDFFKAIENKTLGVDLDLSNFQHNKDLETIVNSFDNDYYNYIVADFGGKTMIVSFFPTEFSINIDYLVPSFNVKKLFELVMSTFGYTYFSPELDSFMEELYITYPTPPTYEESEEDNVAELIKNSYASGNFGISGNRLYIADEQQWDASTITEGNLINNKDYVIPETSGYRFNITVEAYARYYNSLQGELFTGCTVDVSKNGTTIISFQTDPYAEVTQAINLFCQAGDIITYQLYVTQTSIGIRILNQIRHNSTEFNIYKINQGDVTPTDAFKDFKIKDFFKELLYRTGLTPVADPISKLITFIPISQRIDTSNAINWTDKYIRRVKEVYIKNSYAQRNLFKMKYNVGSENKNDGVLLVNNKNIEDEKTLVQSIFYSPEEGTTTFRGFSGASINTAILPMYSKEVDTDENNEVTINYKELDGRFYFIRRNTVTDKSWRLESEIVPGEEIVNELHFATTERTLLGQLLTENFSDYSKIFNNFRAHDIELALGLEDILNLDLTRPYYFEQEAGFYIMNKLPYSDGETQTGEFVRINQ